MKTLRSGLPRPDAVLLRLRLIGRMEALTLANDSVLPLGRKTRGLLAILALAGRQPVLRLRLAELLWSRRSEEQARASLRQEIHRLLEALSPLGTDVIAVERHTLALKPALTSVDAERILTAGPGQMDSLPPFEGVLLEELNGTDPALDQWLAAERLRLREHAIGLFEDMLRRQREPQGSLEAARQLLALDGLHERAWAATIQGQAALGNIVLARQTGERCIASLAAAATIAGAELRETLANLGLQNNPMPVTTAAQSEPGSLPPSQPILAPAANDSVPTDAPDQRANDAITGLPLLAVLPVQDLTPIVPPGEDPASPSAGSGLAAGLTAAIQSALSGDPSTRLLVGSELEDSLAHGRDDTVLRRSFGLDYLIDASVQRSGGRLRAILRLSDIRRHGLLIWAQRFDSSDPDPLAFQDLVAGQVAARLPVELLLAESRHLRRSIETELDPQGLAVQAYGLLADGSRAQTDRAMALLSRSLARDPDNHLAHCGIALAHLLRGLQRWQDPAEAARHGEAAARVAAGGDQTLGLEIWAHLVCELQDRPEAALGLLDRALARRPHSASAWAVRALPLLRLGRLDAAREAFGRYRSLFATHPFQSLLDLPDVMIPLLLGDHETAARIGLIQTELRPTQLPCLVPTLAALGHLRRGGEADRLRERLRHVWPGVGLAQLTAGAGLREPAHAAILADGLRLAGIVDVETQAERRVATRPRRTRTAAADGSSLGIEPLAG